MSKERNFCKQKYDLIKKRGQKCEHPEGCDVKSFNRLTVDHFTPKCIAKIWGWTTEMINDPDNLQLLCKEHHKEKDESTPDKVFQLKQQRKGKFIGFGEHK